MKHIMSAATSYSKQFILLMNSQAYIRVVLTDAFKAAPGEYIKIHVQV